MSRPAARPDRKPFIGLVDRANRALKANMIAEAHRRGHLWIKPAHNAVFATLHPEGARAADMAHRAGVTRQSMGEVIRELVDLGILEMKPDPADRRAKIVTFTEAGLDFATGGYEHINDLEKQFAEEFGVEQWEMVRDVLDRVVTLLGDDGE
jgi:DNA-binding MarR family transcriptional regulator